MGFRLWMGMLAALLLAGGAHAQTVSQTRSPATCVNFDTGNPAWTNPGNAVSSNNADASVSVNDNQATDALVCTGYGFNLAPGATVVGIVVHIERATSTGSDPRRDFLVRVIKGGVAEPAERATGTAYTTTDVVEPHGGAADLWGTTWTATDINDPNFGVGFMAWKDGTAGGAETVFVDHISIQVYYTNQAPPAPALVSPADGAVVSTANPTFDWNAAVDPDGDTVTYDIQADDSGCSFASPELDQSGVAGTSYVPGGGGLANAFYCWRVRAVDQHGLAGPWSATRGITVSAITAVGASPGNCVTVDVGNPNWTNPTRAETTNNSYATSVVTDNQATDALVCTQYGFSIPVNAQIVGIVVHLERSVNTTAGVSPVRDFSMLVLKAGVAQPSDLATGTNWTTGDTTEDHGSAAELWGTTWTPAEINDPNFGARFQARKFGTTGGNVTAEVDHMSITVHYTIPLVPQAFNAFETSTAANAVTGVVRTRVAGTAFSLDVVAIQSGAQLSGFNNNVSVELLGNAATGVALDGDNCPTTFTVLQTVSPAAIANGRSTVNFAAVANSWRDVRVRVRFPVGSPTVTACSTDNFAIRPASITTAVSDSNWTTAGTTRALTNTGAAGGVVHKAGQPFTIRVTAAPGTTTNYDGDATLSALATTLPAGGANGSITLGTFSGAGTRTSTTATYSEAGAFNLTLVDQTYASVDSADGTPADCSASGRYVCQGAALAVGRFVPDHFAVTAVTQPQFRTFDVADGSCSVPPAGPRRSFTYVGQPFGYVTAPTATVEARNVAGNITSNYRGTLWKLAAGGVSQAFANSPVMTLDTSLVLAPTLLETPNTGTGSLAANAGDKIAFTRDAATPVAPFTANLTLSWSVSDAAEAGANQGTITTPTPLAFNGGGSGIGFDAGAEFRYGRLRLANNHGSQLVPLQVLMQTQYYSGAAGFVANAADHCTTVATGSIALGSYTGNLGAGETTLSGGGTFTSGRRILMLSAPGNANDGSVVLTGNLGASLAHLQGNWTGTAYDDNPTARATFGAFRGAGEVIFIRENF